MLRFSRSALEKSHDSEVKCKRPWSPEEDDLLRALVKEHGIKNWTLVSQSFTERTGKHCRERWYNHLNPDIKKGDWSREEDEIIISMQRAFGNQWAKITKMLPGRTDNAVKNRFYATVRASKRQKVEGEEEPSTNGLEVAHVSVLNAQVAVPTDTSAFRPVASSSSNSTTTTAPTTPQYSDGYDGDEVIAEEIHMDDDAATLGNNYNSNSNSNDMDTDLPIAYSPDSIGSFDVTGPLAIDLDDLEEWVDSEMVSSSTEADDNSCMSQCNAFYQEHCNGLFTQKAPKIINHIYRNPFNTNTNTNDNYNTHPSSSASNIWSCQVVE